MEVSSASEEISFLRKMDVFYFYKCLLIPLISPGAYLDLHNYLSSGYCRMSFEELRDVGLLKLSYNEETL